jgi:hypothetical protein
MSKCLTFPQVTVYTPPQVAGQDETSYGRVLILDHVSFVTYAPSLTDQQLPGL